MADDVVEFVAEAIRSDYVQKHQPNKKSWSEIDDGMRDVWRQHAKAAIAALEASQPTTPDGVIVPREPTEAMIYAGIEAGQQAAKEFADFEFSLKRIVDGWNVGIKLEFDKFVPAILRAALAAAPQPETQT